MAPSKKPYEPQKARDMGIPSLTTFFPVKRNRGRPKKKGNLASDQLKIQVKPRRGRPPSKGNAASLAPQMTPVKPTGASDKTPSSLASTKPPAKRTNWSTEENQKVLEAAVEEWDEKRGRYLDGNGEARQMKEFAATVGIPYHTFRKYACEDKSKRREIGKAVGRAPLIAGQQQKFLCDTLIRHDRANDGKSPKETLDLIQELNLALDRKQASQTYNRTIRPKIKGKGGIKAKPVKSQATTTKRSAITVKQQFRWHNTFEKALNMLRERNHGRCNRTGKTFGKVAHHFIVGGDETCFQASDAGDAMVVAAHDNKKPEKKTQDSRDSITLYRTGTPGGSTGPTAFLMKGKRAREGFTDAFLKRNGAAEGSTICMTPSAYMTEEAWEAITPSIVKGIRSMPFIKDNPQWWVVEIFDGFGAHLSSLDAMQQRHDAKILALKEEGDSSHVNQAYDKYVAKADKSGKREGLALMRGMQFTGFETEGGAKIMDQWGLVHVGLYAIRSVEPETWTASFDAVNLDPRTRVVFTEWCKRILPALTTGQEFKVESDIDVYSLLPSFWHGMLPEEKKKAVNIVDSHGAEFNADCVQCLLDELSIAVKDLQNLRLCYEMAKEYPAHLEMCAPSTEQIAAAQFNPELEAVQESQKPLTHGLDSYQLIPKQKKMEPIDLLNHMVGFRMRDPKLKDGESSVPSAYLDIEMSDTQRSLLKPSPMDFTMRNIMRDAGGDGAKHKLAKRKLGMYGGIKSQSGFANDPKRLKSMENAVQLSESLAEISRFEQAAKAKKKNDLHKELVELAPGARNKLVKNDGNVNKLKKDEISAILFVYYSIDMPSASSKKPELVTRLNKAIQDSGNPSGAAGGAASLVSLAVETAQSEGSDSDESVHEDALNGMSFDEDS